jgi:hypothetical protein
MRKSIRFVVGLWSVLGIVLYACTPAITPGVESATPAEQGRAETPTRRPSGALSAGAQPERVQIRWFVGLGTGTAEDAQAVETKFVAEFNASQDEDGTTAWSAF